MVETLVAVAILMIAIAGPLTIAQKGLMSAFYAHDQTTASYLAQDAMEFIKNIRDNNLVNPSLPSWHDKISTCTASSKCKIDTMADPNSGSAGISSCSPSGVLYVGDLGYNHNSSGLETKFSRCFYLVTNVSGNPDEAKVVVEVSWDRGLLKNLVTYENGIFNIVK